MNHSLRKPSSQLRWGQFWACFLLVVLIVSACGTSNLVNSPTGTPTATATKGIIKTSTATPTLTLTPTPTLIPTPTKATTFCGGPSAMYILLIGSDARVDSYIIGLADAIRIIRVDFVNPGIQILSFPRDLYVEIPGIESHYGITHGKLNQAFLYGNPGYGYYDGPGQGPGLTALTLKQNFGATVDHYLAVNLQTFVSFVDALGGIDINLPYVIDGRVPGSKDPDRYFKAGEQHLDGYRTMLLARLRPDGDLKRSEVQDLIFDAITKKLFDPFSLPKLFKLTATFRDSVQTDISPVVIGQLTCLSMHLKPENIEFLSFPNSLFKNSRVQDPVLGYTSIMDADFEVLKAYVQRFEEGNWPKNGIDTSNNRKENFIP